MCCAVSVPGWVETEGVVGRRREGTYLISLGVEEGNGGESLILKKFMSWVSIFEEATN
jgi:hypothetical protein